MTNIWTEKLSQRGAFDVAAAKTEAETIFDRGFNSIVMNFTSIRSFRKVVTRGIPAVAPNLQQEDLAFLTSMLQSEQGCRFFGDPDQILRERRHVEMARTVTQTAIQTTANATDAASVIFGHAILDAALFDFCVACAIVAPFDWLQFIGGKKASLDDLYKRPKLDVLGEVLRDALEALERESMIKKADKLYALCKPPSGHTGVTGYAYDRTRLEKADTLRHEIVHRLKIKEEIQDCDELLRFFEQTGFHFMSLPNLKYDLRLRSLGTSPE